MRSTSSSLPNIWLPPSHGPLPPSLAMHRQSAAHALLTPPLTPSSSIRTSTSIDTNATSHHPEDVSVVPLDDDASRFLLLKNVSPSASSTYIDRQLCVALADIRHPAIKGIYKKGQSAGLLILLFYDLRAANHAKAVLSTRHALPHDLLADGYDTLVCEFLTLDERWTILSTFVWTPLHAPDEYPDATRNRLMPLLKHLLARYGDIAAFVPVADSHDTTESTDADAGNAYLVQYFDVNACASAMRSLDQTTFYDATVHISRLTHPSLSLVTSQRDSQRDHARDTPANPTPLPNANLRGISVGLGVGIGIDIDIGGGVGAGMGVCVGIHNVHRHTQSNVHDGALRRHRFMSNFGVAHARSISVDNDTSVDSPTTDISTTSTTTTTTTDMTTDLITSTDNDDDDDDLDSDSPVTPASTFPLTDHANTPPNQNQNQAVIPLQPVNSISSISSISSSGSPTSTSPLLPHPNFTFPPTPPMAPLPHPQYFPGPPGLQSLSLTIGGSVGGVGVGPGAGAGVGGLMPSPTSTLSSPTSTTAPYYPALYFTNNYPFPPSPLSPLTPLSPHPHAHGMTTYTYFREGDVVQSSFDGSFHVIVKAGSPTEPPLTMPVSVALSMGMLVMPMPGLGTPPFIGGCVGGMGGGIGPGPGPGEVWLGSPPRSIAATATATTNTANNAANDTMTATADGIEDQDVGFAYGAQTHGHGHGHDIDPSTGLPVFYDTAMHTPLPAPGVGAGLGGGSRPQSSATRSLSNRSSPNSLDSYDANSTTYSTTDNPYAHAHAHHHHHLPSGPFNPSTDFTIHPPTNLTNLHPPTHHALPIGSAKASKNNALDIPAIEAGMDTRTTVMIRNIPNKMTDRHLIGYIDSVRPRRIDFLYLRMDFKNGCNVGYAFVNFITVGDLVEFAKAKLGRKWNMFASEKVLEMSYADYQGKEAQVEKFKNSSIMDEREDWRPKIFYSEPGPEQGLPEPFPSPTHLRRKQLSQSNRVGLFPRKP